ncbi:hypothetical protein FB451DRAFT_1373785 [Mycena latifolia]|nr:hypothetical protein FB451DRAFT_1373785 [Mycena latifolia]
MPVRRREKGKIASRRPKRGPEGGEARRSVPAPLEDARMRGGHSAEANPCGDVDEEVDEEAMQGGAGGAERMPLPLLLPPRARKGAAHFTSRKGRDAQERLRAFETSSRLSVDVRDCRRAAVYVPPPPLEETKCAQLERLRGGGEARRTPREARLSSGHAAHANAHAHLTSQEGRGGERGRRPSGRDGDGDGRGAACARRAGRGLHLVICVFQNPTCNAKARLRLASDDSVSLTCKNMIEREHGRFGWITLTGLAREFNRD